MVVNKQMLNCNAYPYSLLVGCGKVEVVEAADILNAHYAEDIADAGGTFKIGLCTVHLGDVVIVFVGHRAPQSAHAEKLVTTELAQKVDSGKEHSAKIPVQHKLQIAVVGKLIVVDEREGGTFREI